MLVIGPKGPIKRPKSRSGKDTLQGIGVRTVGASTVNAKVAQPAASTTY